MAAANHKFTVAIAIDGSEQAEGAFQWYLEALHKPGQKVILAHVKEQIAPSFGFRGGLALSEEQWEEVTNKATEEAKKLKEQYSKKLDEKKIPYKFKSEEGLEPGHHVCLVAKAEKADMIVMGTRGQGTVRRTIMGSVSDYVLHHSHVPVCIWRQ